MPLCDYGCGQEATHKFKNGKYCCSKNISGCLGINQKRCGSNNGMYGTKRIFSEETKRKISRKLKNNKNSLGYKHTNGAKEKIKKANLGKVLTTEIKNKIKKSLEGHTVTNKTRYKIGRANKLSISQIKSKHLVFSKVEKMRYNPDKPGEKEIQVHCKNHNCPNSKEQDGWFTPTYNQLYERIRQLESEQGNGGSYFYCCEECKQECPLFNLYSDPYKKEIKNYTESEYQTFRNFVLERDEHICQYCGEKADHVHHERPQKLEPFFALDPDYAWSCCEKCHYEKGHKSGSMCSTGNLSARVC